MNVGMLRKKRANIGKRKASGLSLFKFENMGIANTVMNTASNTPMKIIAMTNPILKPTGGTSTCRVVPS